MLIDDIVDGGMLAIGFLFAHKRLFSYKIVNENIILFWKLYIIKRKIQ
jgi:hypothetical protein